MHFIKELNKISDKKGLTKEEFSLFIPTLINTELIDSYINKVQEFRQEKNKEDFVYRFAQEFYRKENISEKQINNFYEYGDNIMRYFRLTRYFRLNMDPSGNYWSINLEPSRMAEINQILSKYDGKSIKFSSTEDYLNYLSNINQPSLPWEEEENLRKVALSVKKVIEDLVGDNNLSLADKSQSLLNILPSNLSLPELEEFIANLRSLNTELRENIRKRELKRNTDKIREVVTILKNSKNLRRYKPEQFEKLMTDILKMINDEILIKPNYPIDDNGEPINHSPGGKPDIECYYKTFKAIAEVTLNTSKLQWVMEGQPIMRHLRDFELLHKGEKNIFCIFVAPKICTDTYSQFWISVKYEYDGISQKIVPLNTEQVADLMGAILEVLETGKKFSHVEFYDLLRQIIEETRNLTGFSLWASEIPRVIDRWKQRMVLVEN